VIDKDPEQNALVVGPKDELGSSELVAVNVNWVSGSPPEYSIRTRVKIRYKAQEVWGTVTPLDLARVRVRFEAPLRDITPGQAAVFYDGDVCLGGGIIQLQSKAGKGFQAEVKVHQIG
jgi:tRNA-uridine 2-sulfurtransferase